METRKGLSITDEVANGPVTLLSVCQDSEGKYPCLQLTDILLRATLQIGNTNSRYKFQLSAREFIDSWSKAGPSHHCAIGTGHISSRIKKLSELFNIGFEKIC